MGAKKKSVDKKDSSSPSLASNKNKELEKKVDKLMSVESSSSPEPDTKTPDGPGGPPLLPTEKLPNLGEELASSTPGDTISPSMETKPLEPEKTPETAKPETTDELGLEDVGTGKVVDEIIASESDQIIEAEDEARAQLAEQAAAKPKKNPIKRFFSAWWRSKTARWLTILVVVFGVGGAFVVPDSRYFLLNSFGVRSAASVTVLDETTGQPLKNVDFSIADKSGKTDAEGVAKLSDLKLGRHNLKVSKAAFAEVNQPITVGWGSNPLGDFRLKPVGIQYKFTVKDFLSKKAIANAEASNLDASAKSNDKGEIAIAIPQTDGDIEIKISAPSYRTETIKLSADQKDVKEVALVPDRKHAFISKRAGTLDVYKVDVDGKNEEQVLKGTGREQADSMALSSHPTKNMVALVSTRDNIQGGGAALSDLTLIDLSDNTPTKLAQSERIQLIDWIGDKLIYVKITQGSSVDSTDRHKIISYDLGSDSEKELASTNYFNNVLSVKGSIYYSPASYKINGSLGLFKIGADGSNKKTVYDKEVWNLFRTSYDKLSVSMGQDWFELNLDNDQLTQSSGPPTTLKSRVYVDSPAATTSLWVEDRDGKGTLLSYDNKSKKDEIIIAQSGLKNPVNWLTDKHIIYRINNNQETADYILNIEDGKPVKIRDVTDTAGMDRWYYY